MSRNYKIGNPSALYFITCTTTNWIDVFTRTDYADIFLECVRHCQKHKGLEVYAWCIMSNHAHLIIGSHGKHISDIMRDLKGYSSKKIVEEIRNNPKESRQRWLLWLFQKEGRFNPNNKEFQFWQNGYHPIELSSHEISMQKLEYIHLNPVKAGLVEQAHHYRYSSAIDYETGRKGMLELHKLG